MNTQRKTLAAAACIAALCIPIHSSAQAGVLLQGYFRDATVPGKSWWDNLSEKAHELSSAGFTAVWIPPVLKGNSGGFSTGFDPFDDYDIGSKDQKGTLPSHWGKREELQRTVAIMRANGLDVYVDTVLNHRNGDPGDRQFRYTDAFGRENGGRFGKTPADFHNGNTPPYEDEDANVPNEDSGFGPDLKHDNPHVSNGLEQAGDWLTKALGVQGYRLDYVKGISFTFLRDYLNFGAMAGKFAVGEFEGGSREDLDNWTRNSMQGRASALDFPLRDLLKEMCDGKGFFDMSRLDHAGLTGINPTGSVTFVESHDTQDNPPARIVNNKHLAYAYILTSEGYPVVFYRDYFDFGLKAVINNLIWIYEKIAAGETLQRFKDNDVFAYERLGGSHLLAAINDNEATDLTVPVATGFGPNAQLHDYTGHSGDVFTDANGNVNISIPKNSFVAYSRTGIDGGFHVPQFAVTQEFAGAADLDIKPADNTDFVTVGRIFAQSGNTIRADLFDDRKGWTPATKIELDLDDPTTTNVSVLTRTAADAGFGTMSFVPLRTGWHTFRIRSVDTPAENQKPIYFLKVTYTAPQELQ